AVAFFFSSRRRHTRFSRDWSSDVCSSDLPGPATGDPEVSLAERGGRAESFALLAAVIAESGGAVPLSGLKNRMRKHQPAFSEKALGYRSFLQFCRAAQAEGHVNLRWDDPP